MELKNIFSKPIGNQINYSFGLILAQIFIMLHGLVAARFLGPVSFGKYSGLYAILGVSSIIVNFGFDTWMLAVWHKYESIKMLAQKVLTIKLIIGLVWLIICSSLLPLLSSNKFPLSFTLLGCIDILNEMLFLTFHAKWTIEKDVVKDRRYQIISKGSRFALLVILILTGSLSVFSLIITRVLTSTILITYLWKTEEIQIQARKLKNIAQEIFSKFKNVAIYGFSDALVVLYAQLDIAALAFYSISDTGYYSVASSIIQALFVIPNSIFSFRLPAMSKYYAQTRERKVVTSESRKIFWVFLLIGMGLMIIIGVGGGVLVKLILGEKYQSTVPLLTLLSPILLFKSVSFSFAMLLISLGMQKQRLVPQFFSTILDIILLFILIPRFGNKGVAIAYTTSEFVLMIGYLLLLKRYNLKG